MIAVDPYSLTLARWAVQQRQMGDSDVEPVEAVEVVASSVE